jgi:GntR family transcriptional regulator
MVPHVRNCQEASTVRLDRTAKSYCKMISHNPGFSQQSIGRAVALEQQRLQLDAAAFVLRIKQLLHSDHRPVMYGEASLPLARFPGRVPARLASPYRICTLAQAHGILLGKATETLSAGQANAEAARLLGIPVGARIWKLDRVIFAGDGRPVEWRVGYCMPCEHKHVAPMY